MKLLNNRLLLQPSDSRMRGMLIVPQQYTDGATSCKVIARGPGVQQVIKIGDIVLCETGFSDRTNLTIDRTRQFFCKEENIYAVIKNNIIYPLGRKVLIRRDIADKQEGKIVVPATRRTQSLDGTIARLGLTSETFRTAGLKVGSKIRLQEWQPHMMAVELEDNSYGLIVHETDILFIYES